MLKFEEKENRVPNNMMFSAEQVDSRKKDMDFSLRSSDNSFNAMNDRYKHQCLINPAS